LPYRLFSFPQPYRPVFYAVDVPGDGALYVKPCDLLLELGRVNDAEHVAMEMLEMHPCGGALKRLALAKLIKRQPDAAKVFLNVLRDDLVWGRWAEEYLQRLADDPELSGDKEIQKIRRLMISADDMRLTTQLLPEGGILFHDDAYLTSLMGQTRENRMAFEYFMTMCLCQDNVQGAAEAFSYLDGLSYPATPPLYEEAVLLYLDKHPREALELDSKVYFRGRRISEQTMVKFRRLQAIAASCGGLNEKAEAAMARELGDTYFYYYFFLSRKRS
jgi:hypothetical protein